MIMKLNCDFSGLEDLRIKMGAEKKEFSIDPIYANGQKLNIHNGDPHNCKSCQKKQWKVCWTLSDDYIKYQKEDGQFYPNIWNQANLNLDKFGEI